MSNSNRPNDKLFMTRAMETTIRIGLVLLLVFLCYKIAQPFIHTIFGGVFIAVVIKPIYDRLKAALGGRSRLTVILITLLALILLIVPTYLLSESLINSSREYLVQLKDGTLRAPPPSESVKSWPLVGERLYESWSLTSNDLDAALDKVIAQLREHGDSLLSSAAGAGISILKLVIAIVIAGVLLANESAGKQVAMALATRLRSERGGETIQLAAATVRSVARGILGVALIQALMAWIAFVVVGLPGAGLWALIVLILATVQIPTILILVPIIVYVFSTSTVVTAVVFAIWCLLIGISDNVLKPLLMGRGVDVPMIVIFIGAIGGFISYGIFGLFAGAIILALSYNLFLSWLYDGAQKDT
jgi:predicted PurR-regulated permease PerM